MLYPQVSAQDWIKQYPELSMITKACDSCGKEMAATIPFVNKDYAGLEAPMCSCGQNRYTCSISVTRTHEEHQSLMDIIG